MHNSLQRVHLAEPGGSENAIPLYRASFFSTWARHRHLNGQRASYAMASDSTFTNSVGEQT
jgi:hypothetical protein